jgi:tRNA A-37 threonylcarbamoyl transferase component Bud32
MDKVFKTSRGACVYYNARLGLYKKVFTPSWWRRVRFFLRMRRYPGYHYAHIAESLKLAGLSTPKVVEVSHFSVTTKAVDGILLFEALLNPDRHQIEILLNQYVNTVSTIFSEHLYFPDFHFKNFIVFKGELYALDLDSYYIGHFSHWRIKRLVLVSGSNRVHHFVNTLKSAARQGGNAKVIQNLESAANPSKLWQAIRLNIMRRGKLRG